MNRILLTLFLILLTTKLFASYEDALRLFEKGNYSESLKIIAANLELRNDTVPDSPNYKLRYLAAHNHWKLGNNDSTVTHFTKCMEIKKDTIDPYIDLGLFYLEKGKYWDSEAICRKGIEIENSPMFYYIIGRTYLAKHNYQKAKEFFEKANSIDLEFYMSYNELGITLMNLGKVGEANTAFAAANSLNSRNSQILNNLGVSYEAMGDKKSAISAFEKALKLDPNNTEIKNNLSKLKN